MPGLPLPILAGVFETIPEDRPELVAVVEDPRGTTAALALSEPTPTSAIVSDVALTGAAEISELTGVSVSEPASAAIASEPVSIAEIIDSILGAVAEEPRTGAEVFVITGAIVEEPMMSGARISDYSSAAVVPDPVPTGASSVDVPVTGAVMVEEESVAVAIESLLGAREI